MEMMPHMMENSTMGTTMNFTRFRKMVPKGLMKLVAKSACPCNSSPPTMASSMAIKICIARESLFFSFIKNRSFPIAKSSLTLRRIHYSIPRRSLQWIKSQKNEGLICRICRIFFLFGKNRRLTVYRDTPACFFQRLFDRNQRWGKADGCLAFLGRD